MTYIKMEVVVDVEIRELIRHFGFERLPVEGTFFASTYRSAESLPSGKPFGTGMIGMYCHEPRSVSLFHTLTVDEMWHFYGGDPLRLILLYPDGSSRDVVMGNHPLKGEAVQFVVPAGVWQAGHCVRGGKYSLFGCTLAPGFTGDIFTGGRQAELLRSHPEREADILEFGLGEGETRMPDGFSE